MPCRPRPAETPTPTAQHAPEATASTAGVQLGPSWKVGGIQTPGPQGKGGSGQLVQELATAKLHQA